ncbi:MAG: hypothetical protein P1U56_16290 [Saprospiraceae bacterium]|nr:hypothetical protein [Saprospiraceae bacterium]
MKNISKRIVISEIINWTMRVIVSASFSIVTDIANSTIIEKWIIYLILISLTIIGEYIYDRKGHSTNKFILGIGMVILQLILDALPSLSLFLQN